MRKLPSSHNLILTLLILMGFMLFILTSMTTSSKLSSSSATAAGVDLKMIQQLQQFILDCTSQDGSLSVWKDLVDVNTYHANFAIIGLARAMSITGNTTASSYAWNWFRWFVSHQNNSTGYITDYTRASSTFSWTSTNDMDSTDSYAALFIMAVASIYSIDKNNTALHQIMPGVRNSVKAMQSTMHNGLTWALPSYHVKYLMDQSEVYAGFKSCEYLAKVINDTSLANTCNSTASGMISQVNQLMWSSANSNYNYGLGDSDAVTPSDWSILYPDAASQLWPAAFGFPLNKSTNALCSNFMKYHPNWRFPTAQDYLPTLMNVNYEMTPCGFALIACGYDVSQAVSSIWSAANASNLAYPFHSGTAGELILLATGGYSTPVYQPNAVVSSSSSLPPIYKSVNVSSSQKLSQSSNHFSIHSSLYNTSVHFIIFHHLLVNQSKTYITELEFTIKTFFPHNAPTTSNNNSSLSATPTTTILLQSTTPQTVINTFPIHHQRKLQIFQFCCVS